MDQFGLVAHFHNRRGDFVTPSLMYSINELYRNVQFLLNMWNCHLNIRRIQFLLESIHECVRSNSNFHPRNQDVDFGMLGMFFSFQCTKYDEYIWLNTIFFKKRDPHTPRVYGKLPNLPKYGFNFSKQTSAENIFFLHFFVFFLPWSTYPEKIFFDFYPNFFSWLPYMYSD